MTPRRTAWLPVALALVLLNSAVTFANRWPTLGVHWRAELSVELAVLVLALALSNSWLGRTPRRLLPVLAALVVLFALGRYADVTAPALYGRPVNLYWDLPRLADVSGMLVRVASPWAVAAIALGAVALLALLYLVARWSVGRLDAALAAHRPTRLGLGCVAAALIVCFSLQQLGARVPRIPRFSIPVAGTYAVQVGHLIDALSSRRAAHVLPPSPPLQSDLAALGGADVLLIFVESYGAVTYDNPAFRNALAASRTRLAAAIADTGRGVVSAFVTSPTFGGNSVLAHLTLLSGIEVRDPDRYALLMTQHRPTLVSMFRHAGYRTVAVMPGLRQPWPEGAFYGFDALYGAAQLDYHGPGFGWWRIPDQFSFAALAARELAPRPRRPVFVFFPTVSTHVPFRPTPPLQPDWARMLTAEPYDPEPLRQALAQRPEWTNMGTSYVASVQYFFDTLASYLRSRPDDDSVLVLLGDHQPAANVSGEGARWDVPVHVIGRRRDVLQALQADGFVAGLTPRRASAGRMDQLTLWLLDAFGAGSPDPPGG